MPSVSDEQAITSLTKLAKPCEISSTLRRPPYTYLHISMTNSLPGSLLKSSQTTQSPQLDEVTLRAHLTAALNQYLGLTGTAIPIDILKVEQSSNEAWIRLLRDDEQAVVAALAQWTGRGNTTVRMNARGTWLGGLIGRSRSDGIGDNKLWSLEK